MANYIGEKCFACGKTFVKGDDIVVCPECGTPYHRECFNKNGKCINTSLHAIHGDWYHENKKQHEKDGTQMDDNPKSRVGVYCQNCGAYNAPENDICSNCGTPLNKSSKNTEENQNKHFGNFTQTGKMPNTSVNIDGEEIRIDFEDPNAGMNPNDSFEGAKLSNVSEFIGSNRINMLVLFKRFSKGNSKISTNFISFFFPYIYYGYRKMWKEFFIIIGIWTLIYIPALIAGFANQDLAYLQQTFEEITNAYGSNYYGASSTMIQILTAFEDMLSNHTGLMNFFSILSEILEFAMRTLLFMFTNYIYYKHVVRKVNEIQKTAKVGTIKDVCRNEGGTSIGGAIAGLFINIAFKMFLTLVVGVVLLMIVNS